MVRSPRASSTTADASPPASPASAPRRRWSLMGLASLLRTLTTAQRWSAFKVRWCGLSVTGDADEVAGVMEELVQGRGAGDAVAQDHREDRQHGDQRDEPDQRGHPCAFELEGLLQGCTSSLGPVNVVVVDGDGRADAVLVAGQRDAVDAAVAVHAGLACGRLTVPLEHEPCDAWV